MRNSITQTVFRPDGPATFVSQTGNNFVHSDSVGLGHIQFSFFCNTEAMTHKCDFDQQGSQRAVPDSFTGVPL
jgi:hypothetical protein